MGSSFKFLFFVSVLTFVFCLLIATDFLPFLRGFAPLPDWQWQYRPVGFPGLKIIAPFLVMIFVLVFVKFLLGKKKKYIIFNEQKLLFIIFLFSIIFQVAVLYASPGGLLVSVQRVIHPTIIGYFSSAIEIDSLSNFFRNYHVDVSSYPNMAKYHPPGSILIFWFVNQLSTRLEGILGLTSVPQPRHSDLLYLWNNLVLNEKIGAILAVPFVMLIIGLGSIVIYYAGKIMYGPIVGIKAALIYIFIPALIVFTPFTDVITPFFTALSLYFFVRGFKDRNLLAFIASGIFLFVGAFITLTVLALLLIYSILGLHYLLIGHIKIKSVFRYIVFYGLGFFIVPLMLYIFYNFDLPASFSAIMNNHIGFVDVRKNHYLWLIYNYYDFFLFLGMPLSVIVIAILKDMLFSLVKRIGNYDWLFVGFCVMTFLIDVSAKMHGETGRTWLPFLPFILLPAVNWLHKMKFSGNYFLSILFLQGFQLITISIYLVTVS